MAVKWIAKFLLAILVLSGWLVPVLGSVSDPVAGSGVNLVAGPATSVRARIDAARQPRYPLTAKQVAEALQREFVDSGMRISDRQVSLLADVVATEPDPLLDIKSIERISDRIGDRNGDSTDDRMVDPLDEQQTPSVAPIMIRSKVKLACHIPGDCLPFYAIVSWPGGRDGHAKSEFTTAHSSSKPHREVTMQAGAHATLLIEGQVAHIQLPVISLEKGQAGDRIRVQSMDRKQTYTAEVVTNKLLKGSF